MDYRKIITFYYMKKCVILSYVTGKAFQDLTTFAGTTETPGTWQHGWNAETIINQQLS